MRKYDLYIALVVTILFFAISRLPFFWFFPFPGGFVSDAFEYFDVAFSIENGHLPIFDIRTPGYPVFLYLVNALRGSLHTLLIVQNLATIAASLFLVYAVHSNYRNLTYPAAAAMIFYFMSNNSIEADTNVLTNSLYTNLLIVFVSLLIYAIRRNKYWGLLSATTGLIIYVRPSGLFLVPIIALLFIFLWITKRHSISWLKLVVPGAIMLLALCFYNFLTLGKFSLSPWGGMNLAGATITFMDTSNAYTDCENATIAEIKKAIPDEDRAILEFDLHLTEKHRLYFDHYYLIIPFYRNMLTNCGYSGYVEALPSLKKISIDAIKKQPEMYVKFVTTNFYHYIVYGNLEEHQLFYLSEVERRYQNLFIKRRPQKEQHFSFAVPSQIPEALKEYAYKEFYSPQDAAGFEERHADMKQNFVFKLYDLYTTKINRVFLRNWFWPIALVFFFLFTGWCLVFSRFSDKEALLIFSICSINICSAMLVSLVEVSFYHYTYMTEFTYYLAVLLSPILFKRWITL